MESAGGLWKRKHSFSNEKEPSENPNFSSPLKENDRNMVMDRKPDPDRWSRSLSMRPLEDTANRPDPNRNETRRTPRDMNEVMDELIESISKKKNRKPPEGYVYDSAAAGPRFDYNDPSYVPIIEEAFKGADMNPTWKRNIFSQRPENDDEDLRQQIDDKLKHYNPEIAQHNWDRVRYCILERRQYQRDISATDGFEVGYFPYLGWTCCNLINRYYCPPDANISADSLAHLYGLARYAIQIYNSNGQTSYSVANVIKAMTAVAAGTWYYLTFQAFSGEHLWTFEAKLFESIPCPEPNIQVSFVRLKMEAA